MLNYTVTAYDHCRRLESYLQRLLPAALPSYVRKLLRSGACRLNGEKGTSDSLVFAADTIALKESSSVKSYLSGRPYLVDLLWQDDSLLILNKPSGLAMHNAAEVDENLADQVSEWLSKKSNHPTRAYPVNRLDRGTSGVVLMATSSSNAAILGRQVKEEGLDKVYLTLVEGLLCGEGEINQPLDEKESITRYRSLIVGKNHTFLLLEPVTGRTHQIRRHLSGIGHPVAGDIRYNAAPLATLPGFALHSFRTTLFHPTPEARLTVFAPLPSTLRELIADACAMDEAALLALLSGLAKSDAEVAV